MVRKEKRKNKLEGLRSTFLFHLKPKQNKTKQSKTSSLPVTWHKASPPFPHTMKHLNPEKTHLCSTPRVKSLPSSKSHRALPLRKVLLLFPQLTAFENRAEKQNIPSDKYIQLIEWVKAMFSKIFLDLYALFKWRMQTSTWKGNSIGRRQFFRIPIDMGDKIPAICEPQADINSPTEGRFYRLRINAPALHLNLMVTEPKKGAVLARIKPDITNATTKAKFYQPISRENLAIYIHL